MSLMQDIRGDRGDAAVGWLKDLPPVELAAVLFLRARCDGGVGRAAVRAEAQAILGVAEGRRWCRGLDELLTLVAESGRRPFRRHPAGRSRVGADEALFGLLVSTAAEMEREEAMRLAVLIARADVALPLVELAQAVGLGIKRMGLRSGAASASTGFADASPAGSGGLLRDAPAPSSARATTTSRTLH